MEEQTELIQSENQPKRPTLLKVLCILTFLWSGYQFISNLAVALFYDQFTLILTTLEKTFHFPGIDQILASKPLFFAASAIIYIISFIGAFYMWKFKKAGFHVYIISQILLILCPMYFFQLPSPYLFDIMVSGTFVILYGRNLKYLS